MMGNVKIFSGFRRKCPNDGFTVMELVLALGLMMVIAACLYMVYSNAVHVDKQSRRLNESMVKGYMIMKSMEDDVLHAVGYRYYDRDQKQEVLMFKGESDHLAFVRETGRGLRWVEYAPQATAHGVVRTTVMGIRSRRNEDLRLEQTTGSAREEWFVRRQAAFQGKPEDNADRMEQEILTKHLAPEGIVFSYGRYEQGQGLVWSGVWEDTRLPAAVRIDLKVTGSGREEGFQLSKVIVLPTGL